MQSDSTRTEQSNDKLDQDIESSLYLILKLYRSATSSPRLLKTPPDTDLANPLVQNWLVSNLIENVDDMNVGDDEQVGSQEWKKLFWKRIVTSIEKGISIMNQNTGQDSIEVDERILHAMVEYMSLKQFSETCIREFSFGPLTRKDQWKSVRLRENSSLISQGSTGLRSWQASVRLSNYLISNPDIVKDKNILELGTGTGLVSCTCARLTEDDQVQNTNTSPIWATDGDDNVMKVLSENVSKNDQMDLINILKLDWKESQKDPESFKQVISKIHPNLILGADLTYDPDIVPFLVTTLETALNIQNSKAYICSSVRNQDTYDKFIFLCENAHLSISDLTDVADDVYNNDLYTGAFDEEVSLGSTVKLLCICKQ